MLKEIYRGRKNIKKMISRKYSTRTGSNSPQWIRFVRYFIDKDFYLEIRIVDSGSKYIYIKQKGKKKSRARSFKVRFSNHPPPKNKEFMKYCNFVVGPYHDTKVNSMMDAVKAAEEFFGEINNEPR